MTIIGNNPVFDYVSSSALSLTLSGNTGISPFLTLLLLGLIEIWRPDWLQMGETMEKLLASWWSILVLGILAAGEIIAKCIPALDEIVDSVEIFVVPVLSILASLSTLDLFTSSHSTMESSETQDINNDYRFLQEEGTTEDAESDNIGQSVLTFMKVMLVISGMVLSLLIHFFKMIVRVSSLLCSAGCCQPCITLLEIVAVVSGIFFAVLSPIFAIIACILLIVAAVYVVKVKFCKKCNENDAVEAPENDNISNNKNDETTNDNVNAPNDIENNGRISSAPIEATAVLVNSSNPTRIDEVSAKPLAAIEPIPPPISSPETNSDVKATVY